MCLDIYLAFVNTDHTHVFYIHVEWYVTWWHGKYFLVANPLLKRCLINRLFRRRSKESSKLRVSGLCEGIHLSLWVSVHKWAVTWKIFPFDDVIMMMIHFPLMDSHHRRPEVELSLMLYFVNKEGKSEKFYNCDRSSNLKFNSNRQLYAMYCRRMLNNPVREGLIWELICQ